MRHVLDKRTIDGVHYQGFPLTNYGGKNVYSQVTVNECQYLCEITTLCRYFNYLDKYCNLKFGVGKKVYKYGGSFGYKYSSGKYVEKEKRLSIPNFVAYFS